MGSEKQQKVLNPASAQKQALGETHPGQATAASDVAVRTWARERELQSSHTADMLADVKHAARDIAARLANAERLADATMRPLRVWDEAAAVVGETPRTDQEDRSDAGLVWVLDEAAGICEMFLQDATAGEGDNGKVVERIDALLDAIGDGER